jgi:hypothetical protein
MAIVRYSLEVGKELTPEEHNAIAARIDSAGKHPYEYDPDCPLVTEEQFAEFRPINGMTWEERAQLMRESAMSASDVEKQRSVLETTFGK